MRKDAVTGFILCGGKSTRMDGEPKGLLSYRGQTFVQHIAGILGKVCSKVVLSANLDVYETLPYPVVKDKYQEQGPLGGIQACLSYTETEKNLFIPCDMPLVDHTLLKDMLAREPDGAVVPEAENRMLPMPLLLSGATLLLLDNMLKSNERKLGDFIRNAGYQTVRWKAAEKDPAVAKNINSKEDFRKLINKDSDK